MCDEAVEVATAGGGGGFSCNFFGTDWCDLDTYKHPPCMFILWYLFLGVSALAKMISEGGGGGGEEGGEDKKKEAEPEPEINAKIPEDIEPVSDHKDTAEQNESDIDVSLSQIISSSDEEREADDNTDNDEEIKDKGGGTFRKIPTDSIHKYEPEPEPEPEEAPEPEPEAEAEPAAEEEEEG